ncbi:MAG: rhamnulokinase [Chloroflexi bacterium]|nr:MAG: rhamnulokinase [Chloroflexota bacterium]
MNLEDAVTTTNFVAFDLGASSGRAVLGRFNGDTLSLEVAHRFHNGPTRVLDTLYWNALQLFAEMQTGLGKAAERCGGRIAALGVDTWGVDFGLLDKNGQLIGNPVHYRDSRTDGIMEKTFELVPRAEIFNQTGIQFMQLNTLFQLAALARQQSPALAAADTLLFMPDLFNYWFTGQKVCEYTIASTSQAYNMRENRWAVEMLEKLGIPPGIFLDVTPPGARVGSLLPHIAAGAGLSGEVPVIAPAGHDTACAVAAVPVSAADKNRFAYISSGTWSLMGTELPAPVITEKSLEYNVTNEGGVENTIRLLKNLGGLWLVQECRRVWAQQGQEYSFAELAELAAAAPPFTGLIDPDAPDFFAPGDMPARIRDFCATHGQGTPDTPGQIIRTALESLALKYRWVLERLEELAGRRLEVLHIVGGGTQNKLLNQFAASATGRRVVTGPVEATAVGNILMQMLAVGQIGSLNEGREVVKRSFPVEEYRPQNSAAWDAAYSRFLSLLESGS